jgi:hypothetical protein
MAKRRMFTLDVIDTDAFLEMPQTTQLLYFHLGMRADDDGFVSNPKKIMKSIGIQEDDIKILFAKRFILGFESGIIIIKHWRMHNYISKDRYKETNYKKEKSTLILKENGSYTECIQKVDNLETQVRLGKVSIGKINKEKGKQTAFRPPSLEEIQLYLDERKETRFNNTDFYDFYVSKNWMIGKNKMKDWKASVRTWQAREDKNKKSQKNIIPFRERNPFFDNMTEEQKQAYFSGVPTMPLLGEK